MGGINPQHWWLDTDKYRENLIKHRTSNEKWDILFMRIAKEISSMSKCGSRQIGAILVKDRDIISMGFNGAPAGSRMCQDKNAQCPRKKLGLVSGQGIELCPAVHAECNAVIQAAKKGVSTNGATLYCDCLLPYESCIGILINSGIKRIVCLEDEHYDLMGEKLLEDANIVVVKIMREEINE